MQVLYAPHLRLTPQLFTFHKHCIPSLIPRPHILVWGLGTRLLHTVFTEYINIVSTVALTMSGVEPTCGVGVAVSPSPNLVNHQHEDEPKNEGGPHH